MKGFINHHKWFCRKSRTYVATGRYGECFTLNLAEVLFAQQYKFKEWIRFPLAYVKFMWLSRKDI